MAAQWVTLPYDGAWEWKAMQMHFVEDPIYKCSLHDIPEFLQHQRDFERGHADCINSYLAFFWLAFRALTFFGFL